MDDLYPPRPCRDHGPDDCPNCEPPRHDDELDPWPQPEDPTP